METVVGVDGRRDDAADGRGRTRGSEDAFNASESRVETLAPGRSPGRSSRQTLDPVGFGEELGTWTHPHGDARTSPGTS